ncbi:DUF4974 domain-containing protein [Sphingobacterium sp. SGG-5]|uniref:FecR family protein n=1 Tax=Sphingobacterium sp. SGG-5 TaxID=2710881 RepID=UPI0013EDC1F4|nr:FecR domain-containing protein [Sphingobacterium sp. SGG-5]NGM62622.1 DUF4974 domain-containing protein [Sphingobacterium sp. SGG-5]
MKEKKEVQELIRKYISGQCTPTEAHIVESWYAAYLDKHSSSTSYDEEKIKEEVWDEIAKQRPVKVRKFVKWWRVAAAATFIFGSFAIYQFALMPFFASTEQYAQNEDVILPGGNTAILTTSDGKKIELTSSEKGILKRGEGFEIKKTEEGMVVFDVKAGKALSANTYNTIQTPKGGIYQVVLPDGSKAWLNNASSISFPTQFPIDERTVKITGEVYFEVTHDKKRPFRVSTRQQKVEVLGTKFNINAYDDEPLMKTTLVEGSVRVTGGSAVQVLRPGYEMITQKDGDDRVSVADLKSTLAWKEGIFHFERVKLPVLMRQLARWYDIELVYENELPADEFVGDIKRSEDIHKVLEILREGNVATTLEGRKLIVGHKK